ncbi:MULTISPECIES: YhdB family protein [Gracilibacillus]|uniref:YhdB family protein n=1 Tax=Gracilibacillus TaxID=74385 RepID=UPI00099009BA|nr:MULTISPECIES: YhdB family protein [Gracilibacillus]
MYTVDYDKALYYTLWGEWDNLLVLMVRTKDDLLSKKIEHFLHAYHYPVSDMYLTDMYNQLILYIDYALIEHMYHLES